MLAKNAEKDGFPRQNLFRRRGSSRSATVVLAVALVAALLCAQILVVARSGQLRGRENAAELIKQVADKGLETWLTNPMELYYLMESEGKPIGYRAVSVEPVAGEDHSIVIQWKGKEVYYRTDENMRIETLFSVQNDLSSYSYQEKIRNLSGGLFEVVRQTFANGLLDISYRRNFREVALPTLPISEANFIPLVLLDLFSSLGAARKDFKDGMVFAMMGTSVIHGRSEKLLVECWVKPGGEVPKEIRSRIPGGHSVEVEWLGVGHTQSIYYDQNNQLVWQKDEFDLAELFHKAVSRSELVSVFPQAQQDIDDWSGMDSSDNNKQAI